MTGRQLPAVDYADLKTAFRTLRKAIGSQASAAGVTRVGQQAISNYENVGAEHDEDFSPIDVVADMEAECGQPIVTQKLADLSGCVVVPKPGVMRGEGGLDAITGRMLKEMSDVVAALVEARADGTICAADRAKAHREIVELVAVLWSLDMAIAGEVRP